jgi:drug/metabolite transporter (DMT)-like permease
MNTVVVWGLNFLVFGLAFVNTIFWGFAIKSIGTPAISLSFLFKLVFNPWFILAMFSALSASLLTYGILFSLGVARGRFFVSISFIATILAAVLVLHENFDLKQGLAMILILIGAVLLA